MDKELTNKERIDRFEYRSPFGGVYNCRFVAKRYSSNGNLALVMEEADTGDRILTVTVNTSVELPDTRIAVKNYSENEGVDEFIKKLGIIHPQPVDTISSGWVDIPVFELTECGRELFKGV